MPATHTDRTLAAFVDEDPFAAAEIEAQVARASEPERDSEPPSPEPDDVADTPESYVDYQAQQGRDATRPPTIGEAR